MVQFHIQTDSEIPASTQLYDQIWFAIASRQYPPGYRLPSTRQLAMQTGLHRNTISKVYRQLEDAGVVDDHPYPTGTEAGTRSTCRLELRLHLIHGSEGGIDHLRLLVRRFGILGLVGRSHFRPENLIRKYRLHVGEVL